MKSLPHLRQHHRAGPGAEPGHLLLPHMPTFWFRASDIKPAAAGFAPATKASSLRDASRD